MSTILDGGLATSLEAHGHDLSGAMWSAGLLLTEPEAVREVHAEFFRAGAQVATTASYQASTRSLTSAGYDGELCETVLRRSVEVARQARDEVGVDGVVAGSVGAYGASLADGSEYTGDYGLHPETAHTVLADFHRPRFEQLLDAGADLLACETIPSAVEVMALASLIEDLQAPCWVSLTPAPGGRTTRDGVPLADAVAPLKDLTTVRAVGVNCCPPRDVLPALAAIAGAGLQTATIAYPNSGETWDATARRWVGEPGWREDQIARWSAIDYLGGCCRVGPDQITTLAARLRDKQIR